MARARNGRTEDWVELPATLEGLDVVAESVQAFCAAESVADGDATAMRLVADEICTNICKYAYPETSGTFRFRIYRRGDSAVLEFRDTGVPFDPRIPLDRDDPKTDMGDLRIGGWGLHLVAEVASSMTYQRRGGSNRLGVTHDLG